MITVGYGDIVGHSNETRFFTIYIMLLTSIIFAYAMNRIAITFIEFEMRQEQAKSL